MKNIFSKYFVLLGLFITALSFQASASHIAGASITYQCIGNNQYIVQLEIFRDCFGIPVNEQPVDFVSSCDSFRVEFNYTGQGGNVADVSQLCDAVLDSSTCVDQSYPYPGIESYFYTDTVTLPPCADWEIKWKSCCRNINVQNITDPDLQGTLARTTLNNIQDTCNSSPSFNTVYPVPYICIGQEFSYNPFNAIENEGDSLRYYFVSAEAETGLLAYNGGFTPEEPIPGILMDSLTGVITFTPNQLGSFVLAVLIEEYGIDGTLKGTILRDIQVVVIDCGNNSIIDTTGILANLNGNAVATGDYSLMLCDGEFFQFTVEVEDPDVGDSVTLTSDIVDQLPGATFQTTPGNPATATVSWQAPGGSSFNNSFTIFAEDDACPTKGIMSFVYSVTVLPSTVISDDTLAICGDQWAEFEVFGGEDFTWTSIAGDPLQNNVNFFCDTCLQVTAKPTQHTTYEVSSDLSSSCVSKDTITVLVVPDFNITATQSTTGICLLESVDFSVITDVPGSNYTYNWVPSGFLDDATAESPTADTVNIPGAYQHVLHMTSDTGCVKTDTVNYNVSTGVAPDIYVIGDSTVCAGDSTELTVGYNVQAGAPCDYTINMCDNWGDGWNGNELVVEVNNVQIGVFTLGGGTDGVETFAAAHGDSLHIYIQGSGSFLTEIYYEVVAPDGTIILTDGDCGTTDITTAIQYDPNGPLLMFSGTIDCFGAAATANYAYAWTINEWVNDTTLETAWVTIPRDTTIWVYVEDTLGFCADSTSYNLYAVQSFDYDLDVSSDSICLEQVVDFSVAPTSGSGYTYEWMPYAWYTDSSANDQTVTMYEAGMQYAVFSITNPVGCQKIDSIAVMVSNGYVPIATIIGDTVVCDGEPVDVGIDFIFGVMCDYSVAMCDGFGVNGDGWNGAELQLFVDGVLDQSFFLTNNPGVSGYDSIAFQIPNGSDYEFRMMGVVGTNFGGEIAYSIYDSEGNMMFTDGTCADTDASTAPAMSFAGTPVLNGTTDCMQNSSSTATYIYDWSPGILASDSVIPDPQFNFSNTPQTVQLIVTDTIGHCADTTTTTLILVDDFTYTITYEDDSICLDESTQITVTPNPAGNYTYAWDSSFLDDNSSDAPTATITVGGLADFIVTISTVAGCDKIDTAHVVVSPGAVPNLTITSNGPICAGDTLFLQGTNLSTIPGDPDTYTMAQTSGTLQTGNGTTVTLGDDEMSATFPIGFSFTFFGQTFTDFNICSNGYIQFGTPTAWAYGATMPNALDPNYIVALGWGDLNPGAGGTISYFLSGTAPDQTLVISFNAVQDYGTTESITGQIILYQGSNNIEIITESNNIIDPLTQGIEGTTAGYAVTGRNFVSWQVAGTSSYTFYPDQAESPVSLLWSPANMLSSTTISNPWSVPLDNQMYTLTATDTIGGCSDTETHTVSVASPFVPVIDPTGTMCDLDNNATAMTATPAGGTWTGTGIAPNGDFTPSVATEGNWTLVYEVSDAGCTGTDSIVVSVVPQAATPTGVSGPFCLSDSVILNVSGDANATQYNWYSDEGVTLIGTTSDDSPYFLGEALTNQVVYVSQVIGGCESDLLEIPVDIVFPPAINLDSMIISDDYPVVYEFTNIFDQPGNTYVWSYNGAEFTGHPLQIDMYNSGDQRVIVEVTSEDGCYATDTILAPVEVNLPNVFSPNGDGYNDVFEFLIPNTVNFECTIYNRYGTPVYHYNDIADAWDGENHSEGTYFYVIVATTIDAQELRFSGSLTLLRGNGN